jgi:hypothetical protein
MERNNVTQTATSSSSVATTDGFLSEQAASHAETDSTPTVFVLGTTDAE